MPALPLAIQAMDLSRRHSLVPVEFMGTLIRGTVALSVEVALAVAAGVRRELASAKRFDRESTHRLGARPVTQTLRSLRHGRPRRPPRVFAPGASPPILGESTDSPAVVGFAPDANPRTGSARVP
jgi:hypothetical protein